MEILNHQSIKYTILLFSFLAYFQHAAATKIDKFFVNMPEQINPVLSKDNRLELTEYFKVHLSDSVINRFGNTTYISKLDTVNQLITLKSTVVSLFEMKLIQTQANDTLIGIIRTVCSPVSSSTIEFHNTNWTPAQMKFTPPTAIEWLIHKNFELTGIDTNWLNNCLKTSFVSLHFTGNGNQIEATNNTPDFLSYENRKVISPLLSTRKILFELSGNTWIQQP